jgi:hypothetical protein
MVVEDNWKEASVTYKGKEGICTELPILWIMSNIMDNV